MRARAGILAAAFTDTSSPGNPDIEVWLGEAAAEIDALVGSHGLSVPVTDATAIQALAGVNADRALLNAVNARWPGGTGGDEVKALREDLAKRIELAMGALADRSHAAIALLLSLMDSGESGADNFWSREPDYGLWGSASHAEGLRNPRLLPEVARGMKF